MDNPINVREVKTSLSNIGAEKNTRFSLGKFKVSSSSLLLLLLAMDVLHWNINVVKQVTVELDGVAAAHEDHNLLLHVLLQECKQ